MVKKVMVWESECGKGGLKVLIGKGERPIFWHVGGASMVYWAPIFAGILWGTISQIGSDDLELWMLTTGSVSRDAGGRLKRRREPDEGRATATSGYGTG